MELWVRSQDKKRLTKVEDIYMVEDKDNFTSYIGNNIVGHLGEYKKVGRALEVLDEIQEIVNHLNDPILSISTYVYEMPEE